MTWRNDPFRPPVPPSGPREARVVLIGEAPGAAEEAGGAPFLGAAGKLLDRLLAFAGIPRSLVRFENVVPVRPKDNRIDLVPPEELEGFEHALRERLAALPAPFLLVPLGATALRALFGKSFSSVSKWRGSLLGLSLPSQTDPSRVVKVLPTFHPAYLLRDPRSTPAAESDWRKISREAAQPWQVSPPPERQFLLSPGLADRSWFREQVLSSSLLSVDIETNPGTGELICVGFAPSPSLACSIPWKSQAEKDFIRDLLLLPIPKVGQGFLYDASWLAREGCRVRQWDWDTMFMHHAIAPQEPHSLAYLASVYSDEPFWKDEAKGGDGGMEAGEEKAIQLRPGASWETFLRYNCKDAAVTWEVFSRLWEELKKRGLLSFYQSHYQALFPALLEMQLVGIRVDGERREREEKRLKGEAQEIRELLAQKTGGAPIFGPKSLSQKALASFLYGNEQGQLGLPEQVIRRKGASQRRKKPRGGEEEEAGLSTGEPTLKRLIRAYPGACPQQCLPLASIKRADGKHDPACPGTLEEIGPLLLRWRRTQQLGTFFSPSRIDPDGRFRFSLRPDTVTGRLSSRSSPWGGGGNAQNIDREARGIFLPEPRHLFLEFDLSQVESRICLFRLSLPRPGEQGTWREEERKRMRKLALSLPWEYDAHTENASLIFQKPAEEVSKQERHLGKIVSHGAQRGMGGKTLQENILKEADLLLPLADCESFLSSYHASFPLLQEWFREIRFLVIDRKPLVNAWGRSFSSPFERLADPLYQAAYSFPLQSDAAGFLLQEGVIPLAHWLAGEEDGQPKESRLVLQVHDSLLFSVAPGEAWSLYCRVREALARPLVIEGQPLFIPWEVAAGRTWKKEKEEKRPFSSQQELENWLAPLWSS